MIKFVLYYVINIPIDEKYFDNILSYFWQDVWLEFILHWVQYIFYMNWSHFLQHKHLSQMQDWSIFLL